MGRGPLELSRQAVGRDRKRMAGLRRPPKPPTAPGGQPADPHQTRHALPTRATAAVRQLGVNPRAAVALPVLSMDRRDLEAQPGVRLRPRRRRARVPCVVTPPPGPPPAAPPPDPGPGPLPHEQNGP